MIITPIIKLNVFELHKGFHPNLLQDHNRVGADTSQDIQLFGIGIQAEHCVIDMASDGEISLTPKENAR